MECEDYLAPPTFLIVVNALTKHLSYKSMLCAMPLNIPAPDNTERDEIHNVAYKFQFHKADCPRLYCLIYTISLTYSRQ